MRRRIGHVAEAGDRPATALDDLVDHGFRTGIRAGAAHHDSEPGTGQRVRDAPPEASRRIGYAGVTRYEAVVAGIPDHRSLGDQLNGVGEMPEADEGDYHWPSAANAAHADVLAELFATASAATLQSIADLEASFAAVAAE